MNKRTETRGAKPTHAEGRLITVTLRILPSEIMAIKARAQAQGITEGEWKRRAIRQALAA